MCIRDRGVGFCCSGDQLSGASAWELPGFWGVAGVCGSGLEEGFCQKQERTKEWSHSLGSTFISVMSTLSVFLDVPLAQKLDGSLLKTYKQDDCPNKIFLAYRGRYLRLSTS